MDAVAYIYSPSVWFGLFLIYISLRRRNGAKVKLSMISPSGLSAGD